MFGTADKFMINFADISIPCSDGYELKGTLYQATETKAAILFGPATGIRRTFYHSFAKHLASFGYAILTFDNRGIGDSKGESLNSVSASLVNWGKLDMTAGLEVLKRRFPDVDYHLLGHSAGGQLIGLMDNCLDLKSFFNVACSSGSIHNARYPFKFSSFFFLNIFLPLSNLIFGHTKSGLIGMGESLPKQVAADWRRWCNGRGYVKVDFDKKIKEHFYNQMAIPSLWLHATDDEIANLANVKDMIRIFPNIESRIISLDPKALGFQEIGHMKFFSSKKKVLWQHAVDWFEHQYKNS
ncbi:MAG: alpha/beta fold hydrolase [Bacteroidota bacterium]